MPTRIIALTLLGLVMGFIILMASVSFFVRDPLPIVGANQTLLLHTVDIQPQIRTSVALDGGYAVTVTVEADPDQNPQVLLRPVGGQSIPLSGGPDSSGAHAATGQMTRPGRWELVISAGGTRETLSFILRE
ncbi:MAG: hypothetical protein ACXIU7_12655 [Roseinatronobacter sp.]